MNASYPLVVQSVRRCSSESFHELIHFQGNGFQPLVHRQAPRYSLYAENEWVGKAFDQIGRNQKGALVSSEGKTYDKMSQAINSAEGLLKRCVPRQTTDPVKYAVLPILVVPDNCLWEVRYNESGDVVEEPAKVSSAQYFVNVGWEFQMNGLYPTYTISHLEILTFSALRGFLAGLSSEVNIKSVSAFRIG